MRLDVRLVALGILLLSAPALAEEPAPSDTATYQLPEVIVTALRGQDRLRQIPAASFVIGRDRIQQAGMTRISNLLQNLPGLFGYRQNSSADVAVVDPRGFTASGESSYLKVLVDGQDVRDVENGNVDWDWLLPHDVERLEVVEGPGAWIYGDGTEGGIVNIVRPAIADGLHSDAGVQAGSFGLAAGSVVLSARQDALQGSLRGAARRVLGWRDHSREKVFSVGGEGGWHPSDQGHLTVTGSYLDADRQDPGALRPDQLAIDREMADTGTDFAHPKRLNLGANLVEGDVQTSEWRVSPYLRTENVEQVRTVLYQVKDHPTEALTWGGELGWRRALTMMGRATTLAIQAQGEQATLRSKYYNFDTGSRGALETDGESKRGTFSALASAQVALDAQTSARLGIRQDEVRVESESRFNGLDAPSRTFSMTSPFVALSRQIGAPYTVYASYSAAFHVPTLNQLYDRRPFFNPFTFETVYLSNPDLVPQKSHGVEIGGRWDGTNGDQALISAYSLWVRDEIDFNAATNTYANLSESWHRGVQVGARHSIAGPVSGVLSYTYAPTTIKGGDDDGNQINGVPRHTAYGGLALMGSATWSIDGGVRYVGPQFLEKANQHELPDFGTVDLGGSLRLKRVRAAVRIGNLLDREYSDSGYFVDLGPALQEERLYPAPGRSFTISLTAD